jgi:beta-glucosidase
MRVCDVSITTISTDPRPLARFDGEAEQWRITEGNWTVALGKNATDVVLGGQAQIVERLFGR